MDTTNILFICGGAFAGLDKIIAQSVREPVQVAMVPAPQAQQAPRQAPQGYDNRYGKDDKYYGEQQGYRRKKSIWQELFD